MRLHHSILLSLLMAARPTAAQSPTATFGWHLGGGIEAVRFGHVAVSQAVPGVPAEVRPTPRPALHLSVGRAVGAWRVDLETGWAGGYLEAGNDVLSVQDKGAQVSRYRLGLGVARRIATTGSGAIELALVPTLDLWSVDGDGRVRAGAEGRMVVRVPLGAVELENRLSAGLSGNPIQAEDLGDVSDLRGLRALSVGIGLRFPI
jgi:hypothetical protein